MDVRSRETGEQREQFGRVRVDRRPLIEFNQLIKGSTVEKAERRDARARRRRGGRRESSSLTDARIALEAPEQKLLASARAISLKGWLECRLVRRVYIRGKQVAEAWMRPLLGYNNTSPISHDIYIMTRSVGSDRAWPWRVAATLEPPPSSFCPSASRPLSDTPFNGILNRNPSSATLVTIHSRCFCFFFLFLSFLSPFRSVSFRLDF